MKNQMKYNRTKYILIGIIIGIIIGIAIFYLLMTFRIIQPFGFFGSGGDFSRPFPGRSVT
jgi:hypothetical protein